MRIVMSLPKENSQIFPSYRISFRPKNTVTLKGSVFFFERRQQHLYTTTCIFLHLRLFHKTFRESLDPLFIPCHDVCAINSTVLILNFCQTQTIVALITEAFRRLIKKMLNELLKVSQMCAPCFFHERRHNRQTAKKSSGKFEYPIVLYSLRQ